MSLTLLRVEKEKFIANLFFFMYNAKMEEDYSHLKHVIARNIAEHRKAMNWTQAELAQKLNYSDKAVSKWERAEAVPDVFILIQIAELFNVTLDELASTRIKKVLSNLKTKKVLIPVLSAALVWLVASVAYFLLSIINVEIGKLWLAFIYAIPASVIVLLVFNCIWGKHLLTCILVSLLVWTIALALYLTIRIDNIELIFIVGAPLQIMIILWYFLFRKQKTANKG